MAFLFSDRVLETSTTAGTGAYTMGGAVAGFAAFSSALANGDTVTYFAADATGFEVGIGTYNSGANTLARTTIKRSSNANAAVNWAAGTRTIGINIPAFVANLLYPRTRTVCAKFITDTTPLSTGDNYGKLVIPEEIDNWKLVAVGIHCFAASSSGSVSVQFHNATAAVDMLSTNSTLAVGKFDSSESGNTPAVINTSNDVVNTGDEIRVDVDGAGTGVTGLEIRLQFKEQVT